MTFDPSNIDILELPFIFICAGEQYPQHWVSRKPGIYFVISPTGALLYIGQGQCLRERMRPQYYKYGKRWNGWRNGRIHWLELDPAFDIIKTEARCIDFFAPFENVASNKSRRKLGRFSPQLWNYFPRHFLPSHEQPRPGWS